jgi:hypothetical protein
MGATSAFEQELIQAARSLPRKSIRELLDFAKYLEWQKMTQKPFAERVDELWSQVKKQAEKSGYTLKDVPKLIAGVRHKK